ADLMGGVQCVANLGDVVELDHQAQVGAGSNYLIERSTFEVLHRHVHGPGGFAVVVHHDDVGMLHGCERFGFAHEALAILARIGDAVGCHDLDGNNAVHLDVFGFKDDAHATASEFRKDLVAIV